MSDVKNITIDGLPYFAEEDGEVFNEEYEKVGEYRGEPEAIEEGEKFSANDIEWDSKELLKTHKTSKSLMESALRQADVEEQDVEEQEPDVSSITLDVCDEVNLTAEQLRNKRREEERMGLWQTTIQYKPPTWGQYEEHPSAARGEGRSEIITYLM
jgi:hypothetical protein